MKLSFLKGDAPQAAVRPAQVENPKSRPRGYPVFKGLLIAIACSAPLTLAWLWWSSRHIHAYGVVSAHVGTNTAPARSRVEALYVEVGDRVCAGDTLYVLASDEARAELVAAEEALAREELALAGGDAPADDPRRDVALAETEAARLDERLTSAGARLDEVRRLLALDAATAGDERFALAAYRDAEMQAQMARLGLDRSRAAVGERLAQARSRAAELRARIGHLRVLAGPTEIRALADGVVQDVVAGPGSTVAKDAPILTWIDRGSLWIDAYVPPGKAKALAGASTATVYPAVGAGRRGAFSAADVHEVRVPPALRETMPRETQAIRLRIDVEDPAGLSPGSIARVVLR